MNAPRLKDHAGRHSVLRRLATGLAATALVLIAAAPAIWQWIHNTGI
jgi:hypothetical protein